VCGITGVIRSSDSRVSASDAKKIFRELLQVSQIRGKDSSGICSISQDVIEVFKDKVSSKQLLQTSEAKKIFDSMQSEIVIFGHSRMETNGSYLDNDNNQPIAKDGCVVVHNGIIVNDQQIWEAHPELRAETDVDTEVLAALFMKLMRDGLTMESALKVALGQLKGSFSIALATTDADSIVLATNTGSLHFIYLKDQGFFCFASQKNFLEPIAKHLEAILDQSVKVEQLQSQQALITSWGKVIEADLIDLQSPVRGQAKPQERSSRRLKLIVSSSRLEPPLSLEVNRSKYLALENLLITEYRRIEPIVANLRRCTRCILPESMPFITYDQAGVCNYCHHHQPRQTLGLDVLLKAVEPFRRNDGKPECLVSFSGGRDSSYALHYAKNVLGLKPVAYSYDWGMLTDLGRRNQARMTGQLGVEHILVSADIQKKRNYIRKNITAWLKKPELGIVPLFMAGDKQYFYYLNKVREQSRIPLVIYADNALEKTDFKYGFADVKLSSEVGKAYAIGTKNSAALLYYYAKNYILNPSYFNSSLWDTFTAYVSSYFVPKDYLYIFRHILWEESEIEKTLIETYDWELATDTTSSWRIGDGTAGFYNWIYYCIAGMTEHDTFRSNQIREGVITRDEGLRRAAECNQPRVENFQWYCDTIGIDSAATAKIINSTPKRFNESLAHANALHRLTTNSLGRVSSSTKG
jgi:glucosamine--fructose-6-phosphate aminotransferase (isomerizing)